jgi:hypothetical protein
MSRPSLIRFQSRKQVARVLLPALALAVLALCPLARAQYVGRVNTNQGNKPTLRAIAVLEYTGDLAKPTASRLVPIAVWDGDSYQPGGLYLAQPVPLTVQTGTQYILEQAGTPKGFFDVKAASDANGSWIAIGDYQKPATPQYAKLRRSRIAPIMFGGSGDTTPHFAHVPAGDTAKGAAKSSASASTPADSGRPTLQRRDGDSGSQDTPASNAPPVDPDRPVMHEPAKASPATAAASFPAGEAPETATTASDPNRPHLAYGKPTDPEAIDKQTKLESSKLAQDHQHIEQMVAISDAVTRPAHSFVYSWPDHDDQTKMKSALETIAQQLLAQSAPPAPHPAKIAAYRHVTRHAAKKTAAPALPVLTGEHLTAYQLTYGGGATLVFSATSGDGDAARYITLIAQPDFSGTPIVLFKSITSWSELNFIPRMKLIDALDADADNRAELIFALETQTARRYAIYSVNDNTVQQLFITGS